MSEVLQLQLEDGTTFEAVVDGGGSDEDLLRSLGRIRIVADDSDVSGHGSSGGVGVIVYGPDDVEGHAMTLRLPHAEAARDLQRKLLAAGVVGVIIVGAATTSMWVPDRGAGIAAGSVSVAAGPANRGMQLEAGDLLVANAPAPVAPPNSGIAAERADSLTATVAAPVAPPNRGIAAERADSQVATPDEPADQATHQGMRPE